MLRLTYNKNQDLQNRLNSLEELRRQLILLPIPPKLELRYRWESTAQRIYASFILDNYPVSKKGVIQVLSIGKKGKITSLDKEILDYKKAFDYLKENWALNAKPVTPKAIFALGEIRFSGPKSSLFKKTFRDEEPTLRQILNYLEGQNEHPLIQAAIAYSQLAILSPTDLTTNSLARFLAYLYLYKLGYDFRGLLVIEKTWQDEQNLFRNSLESITKEGNSNRWLDFFTQGISSQINQIYLEIKEKQYSMDVGSSFFNLNDRQREILGFLDQPNIAITNKKVRELCRVSQITASRDLAKLASLGLLFPHGKGRSVSYTKV
jgi:hypothetical protein